ncbi:MAG: hypothetical protein DRP97_03815 [Candidatus Latescibacterota bacterium]|nr:MAG: hypothetical protein DRP97_03815 [Candidatus Latescibacterota bacterium]
MSGYTPYLAFKHNDFLYSFQNAGGSPFFGGNRKRHGRFRCVGRIGCIHPCRAERMGLPMQLI